MTTNLQKMGLRVQAVSYIAHNFRSWKQSRWKKKDLTMTSRNKINNDEDENGAAGLQFSSLASWITTAFIKQMAFSVSSSGPPLQTSQKEQISN